MGYSHLPSPSRRFITKYTGQRYVQRGVCFVEVSVDLDRKKKGRWEEREVRARMVEDERGWRVEVGRGG